MSRDDYIEVSERLQAFCERYPEGSLQVTSRELVELPQMGWWWIVEARAYRTPDDARPGVGLAQEAVPGRTQFTRGSELMNAETSAWGRAMAALGIATKKGIATGHEVRMARERQEADTGRQPRSPRRSPDQEREQYGQTRPVTRQQATPDDPANAPWTSPPPRPALASEMPEAGHPSRATKCSDQHFGKMWVELKASGMTHEEAKAWVAHILPDVPDDWGQGDLTTAHVNYILRRLKERPSSDG